MLELSINFMYVKILNKDDGGSAEYGEIVPATEEKLRSISLSYRLYSLIFPLYWLLSRLDLVLLGQEGYCVLVSGRKTPR
jgi:hypothetical protein